MRCPYLREAQMKFCRASTFKKMILRTSDAGEQERCLSPDWVSCNMAKDHSEDHPSQSHCPFLHEMLTQYCSIYPVRTFVPYSDSPSSRCVNDGHKYCEAYISIAGAGTQSGCTEGTEYSVEGIPMPKRMLYSRNHMWLDYNEESTCHVGIDAFLAWALGRVDSVKFLTSKETGRPVAVLNAGGVDFRMVFQNAMEVTGINMYLRSHPEKITSEPYSRGWLFEGVCKRQPAKGNEINAGLLQGLKAREWMSKEIERMTNFVHERFADKGVMFDGGTIVNGFLRELDSDTSLRAYSEFFSPEAAGKAIV